LGKAGCLGGCTGFDQLVELLGREFTAIAMGKPVDAGHYIVIVHKVQEYQIITRS
jgi:hypothetical protein